MRIQPIEYSRKDDRGILIQVITGKFKQLTMLAVKKGAKLGGHFHLKKKEVFYLLTGDITLSIRDKIKTKQIRLVSKKQPPLTCVVVDEHEVHSITANEDSMLVRIATEPFTEEDTFTLGVGKCQKTH